MSLNGEESEQSGILQGFALILGSCLAVMSMAALIPVLPQLMVAFGDVHNANFWVPALLSVPALGGALSSPLAGFIGDRYGRRIPLIIFCIGFSVAGVLPVILNDFAAIFLSRVAVGIAYAGVVVISTAMIGDYFSGASRDRWLAAQPIAVTLSALVLLPIGGLLGAWMGWRGPFLIFLSAVPLAIVYWVYFRAPAATIESSGSRVPWSALPWRWLSGICLISAFFSVFSNAFQLQSGLALTAIGVTDPTRIGFLSSIAIAGVPVGALLFVRVANHPFVRLLFMEFLVAGVTLMMMRYCEDYRVFVVVAFINSVSSGMTIPTLLIHITQRLDSAVRARGIGIWQTAFSIGLFLSVEVTGLIMHHTGGSLLDAYWVLGASQIVVAVLILLGTVFWRNPAPVASHIR